MSGTLIHAGKVRYRFDSDEELEAVRTTIGQLLQVENVVVLVGAGASMHLGSPSIRNVTADGLATLAGDVDKPLTEASSKLADAIIPEGGMDLEELLGGVAAATTFSAVLGSSSVDVRGQAFDGGAVSDFQHELNFVLALACDLPRGELDAAVASDPLAAHRTFFEGLLHARRAGSAPLRIFTTNYDLVIEKSLDDAGVPFIDGFVGTYERTFNPVMFNVGLRLDSGARPGQRPDLVYLYKLHGSVNWRSRRVDGRHAIVSTAVTSGAADEGLSLIYPTPQKEGEVLGYPYADLLRALGDHLSQVETTLVSVGYGFADAHINRIIARSMESNPALQLLLVEPFGGVLEGLAGDNDAAATSAAAKIAKAGDARVTVVTGESARFFVLASLLPEPRRSGTSPSPSPDAETVLSALTDVLSRDTRASDAAE